MRFLLLQVLVLFGLSVIIFAQTQKRKIAIIGGGIGGCSCAYWLHNLTNGNVDIDLFNDGEIGGRIATVEFAGKNYESGGIGMHPGDKYNTAWLAQFQLRKKIEPTARMGVWNGQEFIYEENGTRWYKYLKMVLNCDVQHLMAILMNYERTLFKIFDLQDQKLSFDSMPELVAHLSPDLPALINMTIKDYLLREGLSEKFIVTIVSAFQNYFFGQAVDKMSAFSGLGDLAYAFKGQEPGGVWTTFGGNKQIPQKLVEFSQANVIKTTVQQIKQANGKFSVQTTSQQNNRDGYDAVVIALPLNSLNLSISVDGVDGVEVKSLAGPYHSTIATFIKGKIRAKYWNRNETSLTPRIITTSMDSFWKAIGEQTAIDWVPGSPAPTNPDEQIWKVFSEKHLPDSALDTLFEKINEKKEVSWYAYPQWTVHDEAWPKRHDFKLAKGLYYVNAIEWAVSAMSMSTISGKNAALLVIKDFYTM